MSERMVDWATIEELLVREGERAIAAFASKHGAETLYGAIVDVETYDGPSVSIHFNTPEHLRTEAGENADKPHYKWLVGGFAHSVPVTRGVDEWPRHASAIEEAMEADMDEDATDDAGLWKSARAFLDTACRVVLRLEKMGAFEGLKRTSDFAIAVTPDPHEPGDLALARMQKFRKKAR